MTREMTGTVTALPVGRAFADQSWSANDREPPLAAHLISERRGYMHHGIYVGNGRVVHYAGLARGLRAGPVEETSLVEFTRGRTFRVLAHSHPRFDRSQVIARARARIGENRYRLLSNNCEHFCRWCVLGESRSAQVEWWRSLPRRAWLSFVSRLSITAALKSSRRLATSG
jgi:hypothetical protein